MSAYILDFKWHSFPFRFGSLVLLSARTPLEGVRQFSIESGYYEVKQAEWSNNKGKRRIFVLKVRL